MIEIEREQAHAAVMGRVAARRANWQVTTVEILPPPPSLAEAVICGSFSLCGLSSRRRILLESMCIPTDAGHETPSALAKDYLIWKYRKSPMATREQVAACRHHLGSMPLFAAPCVFPAGWYVDIVSAYWSIMMVAGWDLDYWPGRWFSRGRPPASFPWPGHKLARNCLVSAGIAHSTQMWTPADGYFTQNTGNRLANMQLYRLIIDVLNCIAAEVVEAGAVYVMTDGYIVRDMEGLQRTLEIIARWGLVAGVKASGAGIVQGPGMYAVGANVSKRLGKNRFPTANVTRRAYAEWLRERFAKFAAQARAEGLFESVERSRK